MIEASVWLAHAGGRAWSCSQCADKPELRRLRGNCGGPFKQGLTHARPDHDQRLCVAGYRIAPDSAPEWSESMFYTCPVAGANRAAEVSSLYYAQRSGVYSLTEAVPNPTPALLSAIETLHHATEQRIERVRLREAVKHGNQ